MEQDVEEENEAENDALRSQNIEENPTSSVKMESISLPKATSSSFWPPEIEECIGPPWMDGFYIRKVEADRNNKIWISYLKKSTKMKEVIGCGQTEWIKKEFAMEIYPALRIGMKLSTRRQIVYKLLNQEIVNIFVPFSW